MISLDTLPINSQMIAVVAKADTSGSPKKRALAVCTLVYEHDGDAWFIPASDAYRYFERYEKKMLPLVDKTLPALETATVIKAPSQGRVLITKDAGRNAGNPAWTYFPNKGFVGTDHMEFDVPIAGTTVRIVYTLKVTKLWENDAAAGKLCSYIFKKISQSDIDPSTQDPTTWLRSAQLRALLSSASQSLTDFSDLPEKTGSGLA